MNIDTFLSKLNTDLLTKLALNWTETLIYFVVIYAQVFTLLLLCGLPFTITNAIIAFGLGTCWFVLCATLSFLCWTYVLVIFNVALPNIYMLLSVLISSLVLLLSAGVALLLKFLSMLFLFLLTSWLQIEVLSPTEDTLHQMSYYTAFIVGLLVIIYLYKWLLKKFFNKLP